MKIIISLIVLLSIPAMVIGYNRAFPVERDSSHLISDYTISKIKSHVAETGNPTTSTTHVSPSIVRSVMGSAGEDYATESPEFPVAALNDPPTSVSAAR